MIAAEFKRDLNNNYMILDCPEEILLNNYQICMITTNGIKGMNKTNVRVTDGKIKLYYEITSKQPMARVVEKQLMKYADIYKLLSSIKEILEVTKEYLLEVNNLILEPEYIYMNIETGNMYFFYLPGYQKEITISFHKLTEFVLNKIDHKDREGVVLGYELYQQTLEDNYSIPSIMEHFYKEKEKLFLTDDENAEENMDIDNKNELEGDRAKSNEEDLLNVDEKQKKKIDTEKGENKIKTSIFFLLVILLLIGTVVFFQSKKGESTYLIQFIGGGLIFGSLILYGFMQKIKKDRAKSDKDKFMVFMDESDRESNIEETIYTEEIKNEPEEVYGNTVIMGVNPRSEGRRLITLGMGREEDLMVTTYPYLIGKMETVVDGVISNHMISRIHAKITKEEEKFYLTDLNSTNGTFLNGNRLESNETRELKIEDEVCFGEIKFCFK